LVSLYISTFLHTVRREWGNVDKHRVDKFYTAVRLMIGEAYKYMAKRHWNLGIIRLFNDVLYEQALSHTPNGLRFHLIDLCIEELAKANQTADIPLTEATFLDCVEPYFALASKAVDKNVQKRVMDKLLLRFLNEYSFVSDVALREDSKEHEEEKSLVFSEVHVGTVAKFIFEVASESDTDERYRKALYEMHKTYVRQIRAAGRDVLLEDFDGAEEGDDYEEEEVRDGEIGKSDDVEAANHELVGEAVEDRDEEVKKKKKKKKDKKREKEENLDNDEKPADNQTVMTSEKKKDERSKQVEKAAINEKHVVHESSAMHSGKKKKEKKSVEEVGSEGLDEATDKPPTGPFDKEKKKKKKKSKTRHSESKEVTIEGQEAAQAAKSCEYKEHNEKAATPKPKPSKKKRKKDDSTADTSITDSTACVVSTPTPKKNKKQKHRTPPSAMIESDGIVDVFSEAEVNRSQSSTEEVETSDSAARRVKFGKMNHCKSYQASMKALESLDQQVWSTANRTPDKSILLKSKLSDVKNSCKKKQKRNEKKSSE